MAKSFAVFLFLSWLFNQGTVRYHKRYRNYGWKAIFVSIFLSSILIPFSVILIWGISWKIIGTSILVLSIFYWIDFARIVYEPIFDEDLKECDWGFFIFEIVFYFLIVILIGFCFDYFYLIVR